MTRLLTTIAALTALGTASAQVPEAWKDWPPEVFDRVAPVTAGLQPGADGLDGIAPVDLQSAANDGGFDPQLPAGVNVGERLMYARLRNGDLSEAVRAWLRRRSRDELTQLVATTPRRPDDHRVSDTLIEALLADAGKGPPVLADLPGTVRLRIADYYRDHGNERCLELYQDLLHRRDRQASGWVPELYGLGVYLCSVGRYDEARAAFASSPQYTDNEDIIADYDIEAARALALAGHRSEAESAYLSVLGRSLQPRRLYVVLADLVEFWRQSPDSASKADEHEKRMLDGEFGVEVHVRALVAVANRARTEALRCPDGPRREAKFRLAHQLYTQALRMAPQLDAAHLTHDLTAQVDHARVFAEYLKARSNQARD